MPCSRRTSGRRPSPRAPVGAAAEALRRKLLLAVIELTGQAAWMPYRFQGGKFPEYGLRLFGDPTDTVLALSMAYPYLPAETQTPVKAYLRNELAKVQPLQKAAYPADQGQPREPYHVDDPGQRFDGPAVRPVGLERLPALWAWAENLDEWAALAALWPTIEPMAAAPAKPGKEPGDCGNARCAGLIAYVRIASRLGHAEAAEQAMPAVLAALRQRLAYEYAHHRGGLLGPQIGLWEGYARWTYLDATLGRIVGEQARDPAQRMVRWQLDQMRPTWFVTWGPNVVERPRELHGPARQRLLGLLGRGVHRQPASRQAHL